MAANQILTASFQLGNSSAVRKRVTILLHDLDFSDLSACTFWLPPGQALSTYSMRMFATKAWTNATLSVYAATTGTDQYTRLDNMTLQRTPGATALGAECIEPPIGQSVQFSQRGLKLVGTAALGAASQGRSVSLSADGSTAIVGGNGDNGNAGAAWVWTWTGAAWIQQGTKLVGTGAVGNAAQGTSVSLSADGNTAIIGGAADNGNAGAAWVWTRSGGVWTQQGSKLVGLGAVGAAFQGYSVSLSADGNTAIVGGHSDNGSAGAAWVWTRAGGVWTQQGSKLVGSGAVGSASQGHSVSLSADGNTAISGGSVDNGGAGAAWVWTRSGGIWTLQGTKLVGSGAVGNANQGQSVSLAADGSTALVAGNNDNSGAGAAWVWTRSGGTWTQQGSKLVGSDAVGPAFQGVSASLAADGNTAIVGGYQDNGNAGAAWVWRRSGGVWSQQGAKLVGSGAVGAAYQGLSVAVSADAGTALVGGSQDNGVAGAAWAFAASAAGAAGVAQSSSGTSPDNTGMRPFQSSTKPMSIAPMAPPMTTNAPEWRATGGFTPGAEASSTGAGPGWRAEAWTTGRALLRWADPLDLTHATSAHLTFASWLSSRASSGEVQVSEDGVTWQTVAVVPRSEAWTEIDVDLSAFAGQLIYVRFVFDAVAPGDGVLPDEWRIDHVSVVLTRANVAAARATPRPG
jgi:hypothetical protein